MRPVRGVVRILGPMARGSVASVLGEAVLRSRRVLAAALHPDHLTPS